MKRLLVTLLFGALALLHVTRGMAQSDAKVLRIVPHANLGILDPIWTKVYITRNHGYMVYDTLFGTDAEARPRPQMVSRWELGKDRKVWTFTLRDGLEFHDGTPVTSDDVIASLTRWGKRDGLGMKLMSATETMEAVDTNTFRIRLKEPFNMMLEALGKPSANVPFIMPKRIAQTPPDKQIEEFIGSGPLIFSKAEWRPGNRVVYLRNPRYKPRSEPPSGTAGGKVINFDRVEWHILPDPQTQMNALVKGEVDVLETAAYPTIPPLRSNPQIRTFTVNPRGLGLWLRFNHLLPPFDNVKVRRAAMAAMNQMVFLRGQIGIADLYRPCFSVYSCQSPNVTEKGMEFLKSPDMANAQRLLQESGYDGTPVVVIAPTDITAIAKLGPIGAQLLRQAGFKVELQQMDSPTWASRLAKRDPPEKGGWNAFFAAWSAMDIIDPAVSQSMVASCEKGSAAGWPCDAELERLRDAYIKAETAEARKPIAEAAQVRALEIGTHVPLGEFIVTTASRKNLKGFVSGHLLVPWGIEKQ